MSRSLPQHRSAYPSSSSGSSTPQILQPSPYHASSSSSSTLYARNAAQRLPASRNSTPGAFNSSGPNGNGVPERYTESPFGGVRSGGSRGYDRTTHQLENQNEERLEGLLGKVKMLKSVTVGIGDEIRESNLELGNMNDAFSSTSQFLSGTFKRMTKMAKRQGGHWCWFMMFLLLVLWIFVILWWWRR